MLQLGNNTWATLANSPGTSGTSFLLTTGQGARFSSFLVLATDYTYATLVHTDGTVEVLKVVGPPSGDTLTVVRGQDGTTALNAAAGDLIEVRVNRALLQQYLLQSQHQANSDILATINSGASTTNAWVVTHNPAFGALSDGLESMFVPTATNTAGVTYAPDGLAAKPLVKSSGVPLDPGDLVAGQRAVLLYSANLTPVGSGSAGAWVLMNPQRPFQNMFPYASGMRATNNATTPTTQMDVTWRKLAVINSSGQVALLPAGSAAAGDLYSFTLGQSKVNGTDWGGAPTPGNWYHLYVIWNGTTTSLLWSQSAPPTGPTLPTGYTYWGYVGTFYYQQVQSFTGNLAAGATSITAANASSAPAVNVTLNNANLPANARVTSVTGSSGNYTINFSGGASLNGSPQTGITFTTGQLLTVQMAGNRVWHEVQQQVFSASSGLGNGTEYSVGAGTMATVAPPIALAIGVIGVGQENYSVAGSTFIALQSISGAGMLYAVAGGGYYGFPVAQGDLPNQTDGATPTLYYKVTNLSNTAGITSRGATVYVTSYTLPNGSAS